MLLLSPFYRQQNWETEKWGNLPKITQPISRHLNQSPEFADCPASTLRHSVFLTICQPGSHFFNTDDIVSAVVKYCYPCRTRKKEHRGLSYPNPMGFPTFSEREREWLFFPLNYDCENKREKIHQRTRNLSSLQVKNSLWQSFVECNTRGDPVLILPTYSFDNLLSTYCVRDALLALGVQKSKQHVPR